LRIISALTMIEFSAAFGGAATIGSVSIVKSI